MLKKKTEEKLLKVFAYGKQVFFYLTDHCIGSSHKCRSRIQFSNMSSAAKNLIN